MFTSLFYKSLKTTTAVAFLSMACFSPHVLAMDSDDKVNSSSTKPRALGELATDDFLDHSFEIQKAEMSLSFCSYPESPFLYKIYVDNKKYFYMWLSSHDCPLEVTLSKRIFNKLVNDCHAFVTECIQPENKESASQQKLLIERAKEEGLFLNASTLKEEMAQHKHSLSTSEIQFKNDIIKGLHSVLNRDGILENKKAQLDRFLSRVIDQEHLNSLMENTFELDIFVTYIEHLFSNKIQEKIKMIQDDYELIQNWYTYVSPNDQKVILSFFAPEVSEQVPQLHPIVVEMALQREMRGIEQEDGMDFMTERAFRLEGKRCYVLETQVDRAEAHQLQACKENINSIDHAKVHSLINKSFKNIKKQLGNIKKEYLESRIKNIIEYTTANQLSAFPYANSHDFGLQERNLSWQLNKCPEYIENLRSPFLMQFGLAHGPGDTGMLAWCHNQKYSITRLGKGEKWYPVTWDEFMAPPSKNQGTCAQM